MKDFLLIGPLGGITYKNVFQLLRDNKIRLGYRRLNTDFYFDLPEASKEEMIKEKKEGSAWKYVNGDICGRLANGCWLTTLPVQRKRKLILTKTYNAEDYPRYDKYPAINVNKVKDIPYDYPELIGVPISVLNYDLDDFDLLNILDLKYRVVNGKYYYTRLIIRRKQL